MTIAEGFTVVRTADLDALLAEVETAQMYGPSRHRNRLARLSYALLQSLGANEHVTSVPKAIVTRCGKAGCGFAPSSPAEPCSAPRCGDPFIAGSPFVVCDDVRHCEPYGTHHHRLHSPEDAS